MECKLEELASEVKYATASGGRFHAAMVAKVLEKYIPKLADAPEGGWAKYCFDYILSELFPETKERDKSQDDRYEVGRLIFLHILRALYRYEEETLLFDPTKMMHLPHEREAEGVTGRELARLKEAIREEYIYEFLRIASDITPFDTLGHMGGVHYIAMYVARQLKNAGVPVDLALVSGAACGHDIGKFGCRKEEEKRIPYLHYYYTDICYDRFGLHTMGHIAANHSTWDLELEDLSVESLLLIYADFRVRSERDVEGNEVVEFHSLKESFDISVQNVIRWLTLNHLIKLPERLMTASSRSESHHFIKEHGLEHCFQYPAQCFLNQLVFIAVDAQRAHLTIVFWYLHPSCRPGPVCLPLDPVHQVFQILFQSLFIDLLSHPIDSDSFLSVHVSMADPQHVFVDEMSQRGEYHIWIISGQFRYSPQFCFHS